MREFVEPERVQPLVRSVLAETTGRLHHATLFGSGLLRPGPADGQRGPVWFAETQAFATEMLRVHWEGE